MKYCDFTFFKDFKAVYDVNSIKHTTKTGAPGGDIYTNTTYEDLSWTLLPMALLYDSGVGEVNRILVFATDDALSLLRQSDHWFSDGTFSVSSLMLF